MSPHIRRARGALLRLARRRSLAVVCGLALMALAVSLQAGWGGSAWWAEGLGLVLGATGIALLWTGIVGVGPDWVE